MADDYPEHLDEGKADEPKETMPQLPDGIGIKLEDMALLLAMKHDTAVSKDDPILMVVSLCNAFLGEIQTLHGQHNEALSKIITAKTRDYITSVKNTTDSFSEILAQASVEGIRKIFEDHASALQASKWNARWCALITAVSAIANIVVLALR